jgi:hypothetical protein
MGSGGFDEDVSWEGEAGWEDWEHTREHAWRGNSTGWWESGKWWRWHSGVAWDVSLVAFLCGMVVVPGKTPNGGGGKPPGPGGGGIMLGTCWPSAA